MSNAHLYVYCYGFFTIENEVLYTISKLQNLSFNTFCVLIILCFKDSTTFCNFFKDIQAIDTKMRILTSSYKSEMKLLLSIFFVYVYRFVIGILYCNHNPVFCPAHNIWFLPLFFLISVNAEMVLVTYGFIFFALKCRMQKLVSIVKEVNNENKKFLKLYKSIVNSAEKYKTAYDLGVSAEYSPHI